MLCNFLVIIVQHPRLLYFPFASSWSGPRSSLMLTALTPVISNEAAGYVTLLFTRYCYRHGQTISHGHVPVNKTTGVCHCLLEATHNSGKPVWYHQKSTKKDPSMIKRARSKLPTYQRTHSSNSVTLRPKGGHQQTCPSVHRYLKKSVHQTSLQHELM